MAYLALYRKYRPDTFDKLIGQEHIVKTLVNQIESGRLGHAYLFTGTRGTGKTTAAKIFAKAINCLSPVNGSPCGKCEACRALSDPSNIDVIEIDAASNNGVNEIRDLREKVQYPPVSCRYKVYIVDEVHMLTGAAFNALLKTLEEPPRHAVFILATTEVHKIPATILSRCMRFDFRLIPTARISKLISGIYDELGKEYDKEAVNAIAAAGEGSIRDALSIADTALSYGKGRLTYDDVTDILGSSNSEMLLEFMANLLTGNTGAVLDTVESLSSLGKSMGVLVKDVTNLARSLLVAKTCADAEEILALPQEKMTAYKKIADSTSEARLIRIMEIFSDAENALRYTTHPRVVFETAAVKAARPECDYDIGALLSRIKELEIKAEKLSASPNIYTNENNIRNAVSERVSINKTDIKEQNLKTEKAALNNITYSENIKNEKFSEESYYRGQETVGMNEKSVAYNNPIDKDSDEKESLTEKQSVSEGAEAIKQVEFKPVTVESSLEKDNKDNKNLNAGTEKKSISSVDPERLKGILLYNLRNNGHEMLWNVMQSVDVGINGNVMVLTVSSSGDAELLDMYDNKNCIEEALNEFQPFGLHIEVSENEKNMEKIDEETEKVKKIFGDDIVIVKD